MTSPFTFSRVGLATLVAASLVLAACGKHEAPAPKAAEAAKPAAAASAAPAVDEKPHPAVYDPNLKPAKGPSAVTIQLGK